MTSVGSTECCPVWPLHARCRSRRGSAGGSAYVSTKFALRAHTESGRAELRTHNIPVMLPNPW